MTTLYSLNAMLNDSNHPASDGRTSSNATLARTRARNIALQFMYFVSNSNGYLTSTKAAKPSIPQPGLLNATSIRSVRPRATTRLRPVAAIHRPPPILNPSEPSPSRNRTLGGG